MHSIINHAGNVVNFLDYTTLTILGGSAVIVGQSLLARLRNEWVRNHVPQQISQTEAAPSEPDQSDQRVSEPEPEPEPTPTATDKAYEVDEVEIPDPWLTDNQTACRLPRREAIDMSSHASNRRLLKEGTLSTQSYQKMKKKKLIEIARAKGISGANGKKTKRELVAKLSAAS